MKRKRNTRGDKKRGSNDTKRVCSTSSYKKGKLEISFDPEKRKEYLTGFSTRKKERRAFGLAMQRVKDRRAKLEERKESKEAKEAQISELERQKKRLAGISDDEDSIDSEIRNENISSLESDNQLSAKRQSENTTLISKDNQFGDDVIVTTTFGLPDDSEDEAEEAMLEKRKTESKQGVDLKQKYSGSIQHMMEEIRKSGILHNKAKPSSKSNTQRKGKHGAAQMKGMGGAANLKAAKKTLSMAQAKVGGKKSSERKFGGKSNYKRRG